MRDVSVESNGRDYDGVYVPEELLQNVYLVPFRAAVEAGVGSLMSAYMDLNDVRKWEQVALDGRTAQAMGIPRLRHTGNATTDVLLGDVNPGGKLPVSWPRGAGQEPLYYNHNPTHSPESAPGFTSRYWDVASTPLCPFGHGLSYTVFRFASLRLSTNSSARGLSPPNCIRTF